MAPKDKTTLGGSTIVSGTSSDDEEVHAIYMRIDCNGDGEFNKKFDLSKNGNINSASHTVTSLGVSFKIADENDPLEFFEDESLWYRLPGNVNPWQCRLNRNGEFYKVDAEHKGTIHIQVVAQDTKDGGATGDVFGEVKMLELTFDDTIPFIEGISPDPKVPIRKTITFEADFYDRKTGSSASEGIKHVEISYNNGIKWQSLNDHSGLVSTPGVGQYADYDHKHLTLSLDTTDTATYPTTRGQLFIKLKVVDLAGYVSILPITYSVDNVFPEANLTSPDLMDQAGNAVKIQGTATDSGEISGIKGIHVYFTTKNGKFFIKPNDGSITESTTGKTMLLKEGTGAETETIYPSNADYLMKIDSFTENGKDNEAGFGDNDGYAESLSLTGSVYNWWVQFDSTKNFTDGEYTIHYVAFDLAGNGTHYEKQAFIKNNKPVLSNFAVGTDVNGNGTIANVDALKIVEIFNYDPMDLIVGRNNKIRIQFQITSNNKIQTIELNNAGTNILPASITGYENQTAFSLNADIDTSSFPDGTLTVTCKVTDKVGISVSQNIELILRNKSSDHPTIEIREKSDRFSTITRKINDIDVSFKKLLTPDSENKKWQYTIYGNTESQDATVALGEKVLPTVVGNYIAPNLSGNLLFEVDAKDDQGIKEIYFVQGTTETKIAQRNTGTGMLEACHTNCVIQTEARLAQSISQKKGQVVSLLFEWEAKEIAPIASQSAGFKVVDTTGDNGQTNVANDNYAINPYITEIVSELSKSHSVGSFFGRSATGKYPIRDTETITIKGWNFGNKDEIKVMCNGAELTHGVSGNDLTVEIKNISGGKLELHQDVIKSQNGKNPTKLQSKEPNNISNNNLDDTREIFVLKQNILKANVTKEARFPRMRMLSNGKPIFVFAEGSKYISTVDPVFHNRWERSYTQYYYSDLAFATNKPAHYASFRDGVVYTLNGDIASGTCGTSRVIAFGRKTSDGDTDYVNLTQAKSFLESIRSKGEFITERVPNASFVLCGTETKQKVHAYLSYFDAAKNSICYRYGKIEKTGGSDSNPIINFTDGFVGGCSIVPDAPVTDDGSAPGVQIIAGPTEAGAYTSLAVHNDGKKAALFWYDARSSSLKCKITNDAQDKEPIWGDTIIIDPEYAGQYVAAKFDGDKIGCAYYCSAKGDLRYATLENVGAKKATVYTVDALLSVGLNVDLEYIDHVPYISYCNASYNATTRSVKVAYQINQKNGADEQDLFTGDWEVYTIPNTNTPKDFKVSIGNGGSKPCVGFATDAAIEYWTIN